VNTNKGVMNIASGSISLVNAVKVQFDRRNAKIFQNTLLNILHKLQWTNMLVEDNSEWSARFVSFSLGIFILLSDDSELLPSQELDFTQADKSTIKDEDDEEQTLIKFVYQMSIVTNDLYHHFLKSISKRLAHIFSSSTILISNGFPKDVVAQYSNFLQEVIQITKKTFSSRFCCNETF